MSFSLNISPLFLTRNIIGTTSYAPFWDLKSYTPMIGEFSRLTSASVAGGNIYFTSQYYQTLYLASKIRPPGDDNSKGEKTPGNIHKLILKSTDLQDKDIWCVLSSTFSGAVRRVNYSNVEAPVASKTPAFTTPLVYPQPFTKEGFAVILTKSNSISYVYVHEKTKCLYIFGDFTYIVLHDKNYREILKDNISVYNLNLEIGDPKIKIYKNVIKVNIGTGELMFNNIANEDNLIDLDGEIYSVLGYDKSNKSVYDRDNGELIISGKFNGSYKLKKMNSNCNEIPFNDPGLNGPVYTMVLDIKKEIGSESELNSIDIYLGGNFSISSGVTNQNLTRIKGDGTLNIIQSTGGGDISFNNDVKCIKMLYGHKSGSDKIMFVGGKFTEFNGNEIKKLCKFIISNSTGEFDVVVSYKPVYDNDENSEVLTIEEYEDPSSDFLLIGGNFSSCGQDLPNVNNIARILISDGSLDLSFSVGKEDFFSQIKGGFGFNGTVSKIKLGYPIVDNSKFPDYGFTRIYVLGSFSTYRNEADKWFLVRLLNDNNYSPKSGLEFGKFPRDQIN